MNVLLLLLLVAASDAQFSRVFLLSMPVNGSLGGVEGGDALCQAEGALIDAGSTWIAWLSNSTIEPITRVPQGIPFISICLGNPQVAVNHIALVNASALGSAIKCFSDGANQTFRDAWTGTSVAGALPDNCGDWTSGTADFIGATGRSNRLSDEWTFRAPNQVCSALNHLYCFERTPSTWAPSQSPSSAPSNSPTQQPSRTPSSSPTQQPSRAPSNSPTQQPSRAPSNSPTQQPSRVPSNSPTQQPSRAPSNSPTQQPSRVPSNSPTQQPSRLPTISPTVAPSRQPSSSPTVTPAAPTKSPTQRPTTIPSVAPSDAPSKQPTASPTKAPTQQPTIASASPTQSPTLVTAATPPPNVTQSIVIVGNVMFTPAETVTVDQGATLNVTGSVTLDGVLVVNLASKPPSGSSVLVDILSAQSISGSFSDIQVIVPGQRSCESAVIAPTTSNTFSVSVTLDESRCFPIGPVVGGIVGFVALVVIVALLLYRLKIKRERAIEEAAFDAGAGALHEVNGGL